MSQEAPAWWKKPRSVSVAVDNPSWILPYAQDLVDILTDAGDKACLCRSHDEIRNGQVAFFLGCIRVASDEVLARNRRNLVVHASDLPKGRGFSPLSWQILAGQNEVPICLLDAVAGVDAGGVVFRELMRFEGHELIDELRETVGRMTIALSRRFMEERNPPEATPQQGRSSYYRRRRPDDSRLNVDVPLKDQFSLLRIVDNERYPAFFDYRGHRYELRIRKRS